MAAERRRGRLIVVGEGDERVYELQEKVTTIGRASDNAIELDDLNSSRHHCQIVRTDGKYELVDLKSRNGTLVNGVLVLRKVLAPGDCVEIGRTKIFFERLSAARAPAMETLRLGTSYFLDPLSELDEPSQLQALKQERQVFLKILEIARDLNSRRVLSDLLDRILDTVIEVTGAERGFVLLSEGGGVKVRASRNNEHQRIEGKTSKISLSIARRVMESGEAVLLEDARLDDTFRQHESISRLDLVSVLCVPLRVREEIIGTVYVDNRLEPGVFGEHHLRLIEVFAAQAAVAIDNARLFEENRRRETEIEEAREELERVNRDLENKVIHQSQQIEETLRLLPERHPAHLKYDYDSIVTRSPRMFSIFEVLDKVTDSDVPVLIQGESGTGKELVARAIHFNGPRAEKRFVSENCAAVPTNLMESEFFGHVRGAFTGATRDKPGLFEVADGGTLFLDEVGDMSPAMQTKLLRVLENGELRRVGGKDIIRVDVRIVSASNRDLQILVAKGQFREDLYYRLNVI
ncbi:MAG: sigma 54-interacting transcriptional regulator, partial [Planctomycetes bacterium]|nr:sigma 54-interacting transcriptional regulator [Planctomycetota bacterium]